MKRTLGTCYYPEQWPRSMWQDDARAMVAAGITWVRIGEFAWCLMEPKQGTFDWAWLDEAVEVLGNAGLQVVMGTPTATPPRWLIDTMPDMLAMDADGKTRNFGSRRHYCFSHQGYRTHCTRIVTALAERYSNNPHIHAWQTDNEYGCHDTTISYSHAAQQAFQNWLRARYETIEALNEAWGNVFWSMNYDDFDQIQLPNLTVTEANPAHSLAFRRFSSDQVVSFNRLQTDIIRSYSSAPISHNFMGRVTEFDHYQVGADLDFATWDSYPLGFLVDRIDASDTHKQDYMRQGDPDFQAFHHDLYRTAGKGRWWVMEQQPGPVNWAPYNPAPLAGMVRLWTWEAFAHGAETVSYFRWRQAPFAQEQLHTGLQHPDGSQSDVMKELESVTNELKSAPNVQPYKAKIALVFDYDSEFGWTTQPHGADLSYFNIVFSTYKALRTLGQSIDIINPSHLANTLDTYKLILAPALLTLPPELKKALEHYNGIAVLGSRTGAKTHEFQTPIPLPPALIGWDLTTHSAQSLPATMAEPLLEGGYISGYIESLSGTFDTIMQTQSSMDAVVRHKQYIYCAGQLDAEAASILFSSLLKEANLPTVDCSQGIRIRDTETERFWFNYGSKTVQIDDILIEPAGVWRTELSINETRNNK